MNVKNNSKFVKKHDIFICTHDELEDRHKYIKNIKNASAIIVDKDVKYSKIPLIKVNDTNDTFFDIYNNYYDKPLTNLSLIGITGTDGKTTTAYIIYEILNMIKDASYLGTLGFIYKNRKIDTKNTTVEIDTFLKYAKELKNESISTLVMEVSSEGLLHKRCDNLRFERSIITNVTGDHLNIHKSFNNYLLSKLKLFDLLKNDGIAIVNTDDISYKYLKNKSNIISYGFNKKADYRVVKYSLTSSKTHFDFKYKKKIYHVESNLLGKFNIYNILASIACLSSFGIDINQIIKYLKVVKAVPGRMNAYLTKKESVLLLDYAHTINATKQILNFANETKTGMIITVLGCAGGRDASKRKEIGKIATLFSDIVIFTMDDPRHENVSDIVFDMTKEVDKNNYIYIKTRKKAIKKAIAMSTKNDTVLVLGKGTDQYMVIKNRYKKYSDLSVIKKYIKK